MWTIDFFWYFVHMKLFLLCQHFLSVDFVDRENIYFQFLPCDVSVFISLVDILRLSAKILLIWMLLSKCRTLHTQVLILYVVTSEYTFKPHGYVHRKGLLGPGHQYRCQFRTSDWVNIFMYGDISKTLLVCTCFWCLCSIKYPCTRGLVLREHMTLWNYN